MILLIDDDPSITASLSLLLKQAGYRSRTAASPAEALALLEKERFDLILQDMNFSRQTSGEEGMILLEQLKRRYPPVPVILMTAWGSIELAVKGVKAGAADFITKPWNNEQLVQAVKTTLSLAATGHGQAGVPTREEVDARWDFGNIVGRDPRLLRLLEVVGKVRRQQRDIISSLSQGRQMDGDQVQPIEQILAELTPSHHLDQIAISGRDHPYIHRAGRARPQHLKGPLL